ncbi:uncharacterized protein [Lolium perenne]|uniref:uncharacterized protein n=1 Tax=Lolium perenne TaxID=4522 RepID=UPI003A9A63BA
MEQDDPQVARLANDELADVLRRLAPRWLAASRCVCKAWQTVIDDRRLLRADLLPLSLSGIFVHLEGHRFAELFSRPSSSAGPAISGNFLDFIPSTLTPSSTPWVEDSTNDYSISDHCNGLLLLQNYVVNPATRRWAPLPPRPSDDADFVEEFIVFDPTVSLHYEVFMVPFVVRVRPRDDDGSEWPPPVWFMHCFSSKTGRWEEKPFVRQGEAAGIIADMEVNMAHDYAAYWRGALYVHWQDHFLLRKVGVRKAYSCLGV